MKSVKYPALISLISLTVFLTIGFWGCENPTEVNTNFNQPGDANMVATVHGIVRDAVTLESIAGAQIRFVDNGVQMVTTNDQGYYAIDYLEMGIYDLECSIDDTNYVGLSRQLEVSFSASPDEVIFESNTTYHLYFVEDINLFPRICGLNGEVYAMINLQTSIPAEGAQVVADFSDFMVHPSQFTTTVDVSGLFSFSSLPAAPFVDIRVLPFSYNEMTFSVAVVDSFDLQPWASPYMPAIFLEPALQTPVVLSNNFIGVGVALDQNLVLTFSIPMDPDEADVFLRYSDEIPCLITWDESYTTMTIDPVLLLRPGREYDLTVYGQSAAGAPYEEDFEFTTVEGIDVFTSNIYEYEGIPRDNFGLDESVTVTFTIPANPNHPDNEFNLVEYPITPVDITVSWNNDHTIVTLTPVESLEPDTRYDVDLIVCSTMPYDLVDFSGHFFTEP